jgi:hypothetical protein
MAEENGGLMPQENNMLVQQLQQMNHVLSSISGSMSNMQKVGMGGNASVLTTNAGYNNTALSTNSGGGWSGRSGGSGNSGGPGGSGGSGSVMPTGAGKPESSSGRQEGLVDTVWRSIPGVGLLLDTFNEAANQRNKNLVYQNVIGGSNAAGFWERGKEEMYAQTARGTNVFSEEEARSAFKGVTSLGYSSYNKRNFQSNFFAGDTNKDLGHKVGSMFASGIGSVVNGQDRESALDFLYAGKSRYGQTVGEGLQALQVASRSADVSFSKLAASLGEVADTAGRAGVNAQMARTQFLGTMDTAITSGFGGGATAAANIVTKASTSYGRGYAQNVDNSGVFSRSRRYMVASRFGMSQVEAIQMQRKDPIKYMAMNSAVDQAQILESFGAPFVEAVKQGVQSAGGAGELQGNDALAANIGFDAAQKTGQNTDAVQDVAAGLSGRSFANPDAAMTWIVMNIAGKGDIGIKTSPLTSKNNQGKSVLSSVLDFEKKAITSAVNFDKKTVNSIVNKDKKAIAWAADHSPALLAFNAARDYLGADGASGTTTPVSTPAEISTPEQQRAFLAKINTATKANQDATIAEMAAERGADATQEQKIAELAGTSNSGTSAASGTSDSTGSSGSSVSVTIDGSEIIGRIGLTPEASKLLSLLPNSGGVHPIKPSTGTKIRDNHGSGSNPSKTTKIADRGGKPKTRPISPATLVHPPRKKTV